MQNCAFRATLLNLNFEHAKISPGALRLIAGVNFENLQDLILSNTGIKPDDIDALIQAPFFTKLFELHLDYNSFGDAGAERLSRAPANELTVLKLDNVKITDRGLAMLSESQNFPCLQELRLSGNRITARGVEALVQSKLSFGLSILDLKDADLNESGCTALAQAENLADLRELHVSEKRLGRRGEKILLERFGQDVVKLD